MNNARTIAALERSIAQLAAIKGRLTAADAKASSGAAKKPAAKRFMTPEYKASISAAQKKRSSLAMIPAKKRAARKSA